MFLSFMELKHFGIPNKNKLQDPQEIDINLVEK